MNILRWKEKKMNKFENTNVMNFENAIRGMRNPLNSWEKSDSYEVEYMRQFHIGPNDLKLMKSLIKAGSDHRKFMRQIIVSVDITGPLYWWKEFDTYKVGTVANSCSTMHKIHSKPIELSDFSIDHCCVFDNDISLKLDVEYFFNDVINDCEKLRQLYIQTKEKKYWRALIQLLPNSYNQKRTVTLNYEVIRNMYHARKNHKLDEWSKDFVAWVDSLPYADELIKE